MNREQVMRRFELVLSGTFGAILFLAMLLWTIRQRRNEERRRSEYLARPDVVAGSIAAACTRDQDAVDGGADGG